MHNKKDKREFYFGLGIIFIIGTFLRLYLLSSQLLLDDEWHSIDFVIGKNLWAVVTSFNPKDNTSMLLNIYNYFICNYFGWSEFTLRLPVLIVGLLSLIVLPVIIRKMLNDRIALLFSVMIALSPIMIFFSRFTRSYGLVMLSGFAALIFYYQWIVNDNIKYRLGFIVMSIIAVYSHILSLIMVMTMCVIFFGVSCVRGINKYSLLHSQVTVSFPRFLEAIGIIMISIVPLLIVVFQNISDLPWHEGNFTFAGIVNAISLLYGSANMIVVAIMIVSSFLGLRFIGKNHPLLIALWVITTMAYILMLVISRPFGIDSGIVILRYMIIVVPLILLMIATAIDGLIFQKSMKWNNGKIAMWIVVIVLGGALLWFGPLLNIYTSPNNFTNHSAYEYSYQPIQWRQSESHSTNHSYSVSSDQIPKFYHWLGTQSGIPSVIEYPFDICNYNNLLYYYQHFHKKNVIVGYTIEPTYTHRPYYPITNRPAGTNISIGISSADQIVSRIIEKRFRCFANMVDIMDSESVMGSGAAYIILHKYIMALEYLPNICSISVYYRAIPAIAEIFQRRYGHPVFEDRELICFKITKETINN